MLELRVDPGQAGKSKGDGADAKDKPKTSMKKTGRNVGLDQKDSSSQPVQMTSHEIVMKGLKDKRAKLEEEMGRNEQEWKDAMKNAGVTTKKAAHIYEAHWMGSCLMDLRDGVVPNWQRSEDYIWAIDLQRCISLDNAATRDKYPVAGIIDPSRYQKEVRVDLTEEEQKVEDEEWQRGKQDGWLLREANEGNLGKHMKDGQVVRPTFTPSEDDHPTRHRTVLKSINLFDFPYVEQLEMAEDDKELLRRDIFSKVQHVWPKGDLGAPPRMERPKLSKAAMEHVVEEWQEGVHYTVREPIDWLGHRKGRVKTLPRFLHILLMFGQHRKIAFSAWASEAGIAASERLWMMHMVHSRTCISVMVGSELICGQIS